MSQQKTKRISVRVTDAEKAAVRANAAALGMSEAAFARLLFSLPVESVEQLAEGGVLVVDGASCARVARQARSVGNLYNQAVRALNTIASKRFMTEEHTIEHLDSARALLGDATDRLDGIAGDLEAMRAASSVGGR